ncbi:DUF3159 domain-containing protein [Pseudofrankia inefficax]|uniref:DUF3159 domain-containing protein n=1 Tax=Pseudofrankia inefficax (strain DSM 45817 / CECT 9037 / DDB 130130 / EuI1c) TaxID=298654 RepID=E3IZ25_PSEI1|nr:DUF3159 domain-containing protein [Pseudofrankia inefficax]ADP80308.1 hypothetical protein FraEuI1c_2269 [Pseudofrankia inefficax]
MPASAPRGADEPDVLADEPGSRPPVEDPSGQRPGPRRPAGDDEPPEFKISLADSIGGPRGIVDSTMPTIAFVLVNSAAGLLSGIIAAAVVAVAIFILRLVRREPKQQAVSGLFAVAVAGFVASRTKSTKGYFLPSILKNAGAIVIGVASLALRRPLAGYVMAGFDQRYAGWRDHRDTMRAANWATGVWIIVYVLRFGIQGSLYWAGETGWLEAANLALGLPLFGLAVLATLAIVRRMAPAARFAPPEDGPSDEDAPAGQPARTDSVDE